MSEKAIDLVDYLKKLKAELKLTNWDLAQRLGMSNEIIKQIESEQIKFENLTLGIYRDLITIKNWKRTYPYEIFIKQSISKNLLKSFSQFLKNIIENKSLSIEEIAQLDNLDSEFVAQILEEEIHPDRVSILFIKRLLILEERLTESEINDYFYQPIVTTEFDPFEVARFSDFVSKLRKELDLNQIEFGAEIGMTDSNVSRFETRKVNPDNVKIGTFRHLAAKKGWTVEQLFAYIYGLDSYSTKETYEFLLTNVLKLSAIAKSRLIKELSSSLEESLTYHSMVDFSFMLRDFINRENLSIEETAIKLKIKPVTRLEALLNQTQLPSNIDLMRLASNHEFTKENGDRWTYEELRDMIFEKFS